MTTLTQPGDSAFGGLGYFASAASIAVSVVPRESDSLVKTVNVFDPAS